MRITIEELLAGIESKNGFPLDGPQKEAISFGAGPLLIAAGPGTGKTEVLVARALKLLCCDGVAPGSIVLTTFTEKAARSLQDRLAEALLSLTRTHQQLEAIDVSELRIGTLHSLCNDILQEYRYTAYQNLRLLDEVEGALLVHRMFSKSDPALLGKMTQACQRLYDSFSYLVNEGAATRPFDFVTRWEWSLALVKLFNRVVEDRLDIGALNEGGSAPQAIASLFTLYTDALRRAHACDFSTLLGHFADFLSTGQGQVFLRGANAGTTTGETGVFSRAPLTHVLVDEYQDTNPIQEEIYLRLCDSGPHNLTVVGDDDQALYRFRGGTVECMVGFGAACQNRWALEPRVIYLTDNHRSVADIVEWCNEYISGFPTMAQTGVRIAGKPPLKPSLASAGNYPALSLIRASKVDDCATALADLVFELKANGVVADYSQCVLLLRSTKNSPRYAKPYLTQFESRGIPVYNPRSKDFLEQEEIAQCLGAFIRITDPDLSHLPKPKQVGSGSETDRLRNLILSWTTAFDAIAGQYPALAAYVKASADSISTKRMDQVIVPVTQTIFYRILSLEPFVTHQQNPASDLRLGKLTRLFESFSSRYGRALRTDKTIDGQVAGQWFGSFYFSLCGFLAARGLDDDEDEESVCPKGFLPVMTVHQAKGLEFDFVFVGNLGSSVRPNEAHRLEEDLRLYRASSAAVVHPVSECMWHDEIRQHFVAYSRARHALVLVATDGQLSGKSAKTASFGQGGGGSVRQRFLRL